MNYAAIVSGLNKIDWDIKSPLWQGVIMQGTKI